MDSGRFSKAPTAIYSRYIHTTFDVFQPTEYVSSRSWVADDDIDKMRGQALQIYGKPFGLECMYRLDVFLHLYNGHVPPLLKLLDKKWEECLQKYPEIEAKRNHVMKSTVNRLKAMRDLGVPIFSPFQTNNEKMVFINLLRHVALSGLDKEYTFYDEKNHVSFVALLYVDWAAWTQYEDSKRLQAFNNVKIVNYL